MIDVNSADRHPLSLKASTEGAFSFSRETPDGFVLSGPSGDRVLTRTEILKFPKGAIPETVSQATGARLHTPLLADINLMSGRPGKNMEFLRATRKVEPLRALYMEELGSGEGISPFDPEGLPQVFYHAALRVVEHEGRTIDQVQALQERGMMGSPAKDALFYVSAKRDFSLKELPPDPIQQVCLMTIDTGKLAALRDVYPDPESIALFSGEWGIDYVIPGGLPASCVTQVEIFNQH